MNRSPFVWIALGAGGLLALAVAPAAHAQLVTFVGSDAGAGPIDPRPGSALAALHFRDAANDLGTIKNIDFESALVGGFSSLTLASGVTLTGTANSGNSQTIRATSVNPASLYGYNTTAGGSHFLFLNGGTAVFTFAKAIDAFGAYFTGLQTAFGTSTVTFTDGSTDSVSLPGFTSGGVAFVGFTDSGKLISTVTINVSDDAIGVDDVHFGAAASTPEPGMVVSGLSMLSMTGLGLVRGRCRAKRGSTINVPA